MRERERDVTCMNSLSQPHEPVHVPLYAPEAAPVFCKVTTTLGAGSYTHCPLRSHCACAVAASSMGKTNNNNNIVKASN